MTRGKIERISCMGFRIEIGAGRLCLCSRPGLGEIDTAGIGECEFDQAARGELFGMGESY